jgi:DNA-binding CsgD family transcriptional regulator
VALLAEPYAVDAAELYGKTGGNPFFVVEALAAGSSAIPDTVRDAVFARAARLGVSARRLLEAVSIVAAEADLELLGKLVGAATDALDECLASGMLHAEASGVAFRHELARLAIEESIPPAERLELHRQALAALADPERGSLDSARLAHHAEAAGDRDGVRRFAPAAAAAAESVGAFREAAAQYERALRFGERLPPAERADLLERRARACYVTDQYDEGIAAVEAALVHRRALGDARLEGDALRELSRFLWCPGRTAESRRAAEAAVTLLETLPPSRELAVAYLNLSFNRGAALDVDGAAESARLALDLARRVHDDESALHARTLSAWCGLPEGFAVIERNLDEALQAGLDEQVTIAYHLLVCESIARRDYGIVDRHLEPALKHSSDRGDELSRLYLLAYRARLELQRGRWSEAAATARRVLEIPRTSTTPRINPLVVLGLVRARRGDPEVWPLLDEAWALAEPTGELPRLWPVAAARAEAAWIAGDKEDVGAATEAAFTLARERKASWATGELAVWRRRAGLDDESRMLLPEPYRFELAGKWKRAATAWTALGCDYEAALARAQADDEPALRQAHDELRELEAHPVATIVARRLFERGARGVPRGPRQATRENPAGLTGRELEVLALVVEGLQNGQIATELVVSKRTIDHHVGAILRKLGARTRAEANTTAVRRGFVDPGPERRRPER